MTSATSAEPRVFLQLWIDVLVGGLQHLDQIVSLGRVGRREEGVGRALVGGPARTTDTVNVVLRVVRKIKVDDELDIVHI